MAKKPSKKPEISITRFEPPKMNLDSKKIDALKTLMSDEGFKWEIGDRFKGIVDAYEAGCKSSKKGKK